MMDISKLTPEQRQALKQELLAEEKAAEEEKKKGREEYKAISRSIVQNNIKKLHMVAMYMGKVKTDVFNDFSTVIAMKKELYDVKDGQQSHSFTDEEGNTIELGYRVIDQWDDTVTAGIEKVKEYMESLATDEKTGKLVGMINKLLKKDAKGNLKANRVLDLQNLAEELGDPVFTEGVDIIKSSYRPSRSAFYIEASTRNALGKRVGIPLSFSSVDFIGECKGAKEFDYGQD